MGRITNKILHLIVAALLATTLLQAGCYTHQEDEEDQDKAAVSINFGGHGTMSVLSGEESAPDLQAQAIPALVTHIDLHVSGPEMEAFSERFEIPENGDDLIVELTFPVGADRLFEADALRITADEEGTILYQGQTLADLELGANTVTISMQGASIVGKIFYIHTEWPGPVDSPLTNHVETTGPLPLETDEKGNYRIDLLPLNVTHRVEVYPVNCPDDDRWVDCQAFGEIVLTEVGEEGVLDMYIIPQAGAYNWMTWASSVVPNSGGPGDVVTVFGVDFSEAATGEEPTLEFIDAFQEYTQSENMIDWSPAHITAEVPENNEIQAVAGSSPGASGIFESNFLPFAYTETN